MAGLRRSIWSLFWLICTSGALVLAAVLFSDWRATLQQQEAHHQFRVELLAEYVTGTLRTQELVLDVVGRELRKSGFELDKPQTMSLLDSVLDSSPTLAGLGVARPDGQVVTVTSGVDRQDLPNLLAQEQTRTGFGAALETDKMVLGRTYYLDIIERWIIPIRKALRSDQGEIVAVLTGAIKLKGPDGIFRRPLHQGSHDAMVLLRDRDGYVQFMSRQGALPQIYSVLHRSEAERQVVRAALLQRSPLSLEEIRGSGRAHVYYLERQGDDILGASIFDPRYELWIVYESRLAPIRQAFFIKALIWAGLFLGLAAILYYLFRLIDRAEQKRRAELFHQSRHDALTTLVNRVGLLDQVEARIKGGEGFSVILLDIDNFRGINDHFGQEHGDMVLVELARCLREIAGGGQLVTRLGGDEFAIVSSIHAAGELETFCRFLLSEIAHKMAFGPLRLRIGASVGAALYPDHGNTFNSIIRSAHLALYEAKKSRNEVCLYRRNIETEYLRRVEIEQRLRTALLQNKVFMVYQPQCDRHGRIQGLEALARWQDDELGYVPPNEFVAVAETSGLMVALGDYVLERSLKEFSELRSVHSAPLEIAVNISVLQFMQPGFAESVISRLHHHRVNAQSLILEITESLFMSGQNQVVPVLDRLRQAGIRLSMDDFGTGYSSLSLLRKLPIDELKVDKSFVDGLLEDPQARTMIESIIAIARNHRMELIAEGVESKDQVEALLEMGCERFQGYYFGRPQAMKEIRTLLALDQA